MSKDNSVQIRKIVAKATIACNAKNIFSTEAVVTGAVTKVFYALCHAGLEAVSTDSLIDDMINTAIATTLDQYTLRAQEINDADAQTMYARILPSIKQNVTDATMAIVAPVIERLRVSTHEDAAAAHELEVVADSSEVEVVAQSSTFDVAELEG